MRTTLRGQILRLEVGAIPDGGGPQVPRGDLDPGDNPWANAADLNERLVFAYGMRNPWRFQIDRVTGVLYGCDVGEADFEEQNEIHAGDFLGWPWREANLSFPRGSRPEPGGQGAMPYTPPIAFFSRDGGFPAVISAGMYRPAIGGSHNWPPAYYPDRGDVFYMDYYVGDLQRLYVEADGTTVPMIKRLSSAITILWSELRDCGATSREAWCASFARSIISRRSSAKAVKTLARSRSWNRRICGSAPTTCRTSSLRFIAPCAARRSGSNSEAMRSICPSLRMSKSLPEKSRSSRSASPTA